MFRKVANFFRSSNIIKYPLSIRRIKLKDGYDGLCEFKNNKFIIKINKTLSEQHSVDVLLHEIAHALAWNTDTDLHGPNWGKAYSKIYRIFLKTFIEN